VRTMSIAMASRAYTADAFERQQLGVLSLDDGGLRFRGAFQRSHDIAVPLAQITRANFAFGGADVVIFTLQGGTKLRFTFANEQNLAAGTAGSLVPVGPGANVTDPDRDRPVIDAVERIAEARDVPMAQIAMAWVLRNPVVTAPIVGATKPHYLDDAAAAVNEHYRVRDAGGF